MTEKSRSQIQVEEFHRIFGHPIGDTPHLLDEARWKLRLRWMREELDEFEEAMEAGDLVKGYDALIDCHYFIDGTHVEMGTIAQPGFDIVHGTNMAKLDVDGKPILNEEGKVQKPEGWVPPEALHAMELRRQTIAAEVRRIATVIAELDEEEHLPYSLAADMAKLPISALAEVSERVEELRSQAIRSRMLAILDPAEVARRFWLGEVHG